MSGLNCDKFFLRSILDSRDFRLELWRFDFSQKTAYLSKAWHTANSVWTAFGANSWMNWVKLSSSFDSRDATFWSSLLWRFDFSQKAASLSKAWHTANSVWTAFGANSWDENWSSEEKLPMHSDPQMKMDCGHSNKMGMELSVNEIGRWIFANPHKARVLPLL